MLAEILLSTARVIQVQPHFMVLLDSNVAYHAAIPFLAGVAYVCLVM